MCMKISMGMGGRNPIDKELVSVTVPTRGSDIDMANELSNGMEKKTIFPVLLSVIIGKFY